MAKLDELDFKILRMLRENAEAPLKTMADALGKPKSTIHARIKRLQEDNIIKRFTVDLNYELLNYSMTAFIMLTFDQSATDLDQEKVAAEIAKIPFVQEVHLIAGEWDIVLKIRAKDINHLGDFSVKQLKTIPGIGKSLTFVTLKPIKDHTNGPYVVEESLNEFD